MLNTTTLPIFNQLKEHDCAISHIIFSENGEYLVTADVDHEVVVWKAGVEHYRLNFRSVLERFWGIDRVRAIVVDDKQNTLYVAAGGRLHALDLETGARKWIYAPPYVLCFLITSPVAMVVHNDGNLIAVFDDGAMEMWSPEGIRMFRFRENDVPTKLIQVHKDDSVIGTDGFSVTIWDPKTQAKVGKLTVDERIFGFAGSADDSVCATRTYDSVTLWGVDSASRIARIPVGVGLPAMTFVGSRKLVAILEEKRVRLFDYAGNHIADCPVEEPHRAVCVSASYDGTVLTIGCEDGIIRFYDLTLLDR